MLTRDPTEIEGVNWNAVSAQSWARIESLKTKRFCLCSIDHFPDIDSNFLEQDFQFIDHRDVDTAICVFENFACFGDFAGANRNGSSNGSGVKFVGQLQAFFTVSANHFGNGACGKLWITRIFTFRAVSYE